MAYQQIKDKRGSFNLLSLVVGMLLIIAIFTGIFSYIQVQADDSGVTIPIKYYNTSEEFETYGSSIQTNSEEIQNNYRNIIEAESTSEVAWNGLKGIGNVLLLPISFLDDALNLQNSLIGMTSMLPSWATGYLFTGILVGVIFLLISLLKGEPRMLG